MENETTEILEQNVNGTEAVSDVDAIVKRLEEVGEGLFYCGHWPKWMPFGFSRGWIDVEKTKWDGWKVLWTNGKTYHQLLYGPAFSVDFYYDHYEKVMKTAVTWWFVNDKEEQEEIVRFISDKIYKAHDWKCT